MKMDNSDFNNKVKDTLRNFDMMNKGLSNAGEIDLTSFEQSLSKMESRVSASGVVIGTLISRLTSSAIDKGQKMWGAVVDPLVEGGKKRALNIEQAKFQFAGLGMDVEKTMKSALDAVQGTAYGLDEAAVVAGQFGATGIKAGEQMTAYLRGISGVAAMTGSSYSDIGSIFTTVAGNGRLMGAELNRMAVRGVNAAAILAKEFGVTEGEIRKMVTDGKISFDMFAQAMNNAFGEHATKANETYTGSLSNVRAALGRIGAAVATPEFENKKNIFNALTPKIDELAEALGPLIEAWNRFRKMRADNLINLINKISFKKFHELGGTTNLAQAFNNVIDAGTAIMDGFKNAFSGVTKSSGLFTKALVGITVGIRKFSELILLSGKLIGQTSVIFKMLFDLIKSGWGQAVRLAKVLKDMFPKSSGSKAGGFIKNISEASNKFKDAINNGTALSKVLKVLNKGMEKTQKAMVIMGDAIEEAMNILFKGDYIGIGPWEEDSKITSFLYGIRSAAITTVEYLNKISFDGIFRGIKKAYGWIVDGITMIADKVSTIWNAIVDNFPSMNTIFAGGFLAGMFTIFGFLMKLVYDFVKNFREIKKVTSIMDTVDGILGNFKDVMEEVQGVLKAFTLEIKSKALLNIALAVAVLAGSLFLISRLDGAQIAWGLGAIVVSLGALVGALALMTKYDITGTGNGGILQILALALALNIITTAVKRLSKLDLVDLSKGVVAVVVLLGALAGSMILLSKFDIANKGSIAAGQILIFAFAINIMAMAVKKMGKLKLADVSKGVGAVVVLLGALSGAIILMSKFSGPQLGVAAAQFIAIAGALYLITSAVKRLAKIETSNLWIAVGAIGTLFAAIAIFLKVANSASFGPSDALGLVILSASIHLMASAISRIAKIDDSNLKKGLFTIAGILGVLGVFALATSNSNLHVTGLGLMLVAAALTTLVVPIAMLGKMKMSTLAKGVGALAVALVAIGAASMLMTNMLMVGAGLMVMAIAINMLLPPIMALSLIPFGKIVGGMAGLAIGLALVGGAAALLGLAAAPLLLGAGALAVLGVALFLAGAGVSLFGAGLVSLTVLMGTSVVAIVAYLGTLIVGFATLIPKAVEFIWFLLISMAEAFEKNAPVLAAAIYRGMIKVMNVMAEYIPQFAASATMLILAFIQAFENYFPVLVLAVTGAFITLLETIALNIQENGPKMIDAFKAIFVEIMILFVTAGAEIIGVLFGWIPGVSEAAAAVGRAAETTIRNKFDVQKVAQDKNSEFNSTIEGNAGSAFMAGELIGTSAMDGVGVPDFSKVGDEHGTNFVTGIESHHTYSETAGKLLAERGKTGASGIDMNTTGKNFGRGFASGIGKAKDSVVAAAKAMARVAKSTVERWLGIESPSREMRKDGGFFGEGFALGIRDMTKKVSSSAASLASTAVDSLNEFIDGFRIPEDDNTIHFRAILDYDQFDPNGFGGDNPRFSPNTRYTNSLATSARNETRTNNPEPVRTDSGPSEDNQPKPNNPAVIQVVTPDKREVARWIVDDVTEFQEFKMATNKQF